MQIDKLLQGHNPKKRVQIKKYFKLARSIQAKIRK